MASRPAFPATAPAAPAAPTGPPAGSCFLTRTRTPAVDGAAERLLKVQSAFTGTNPDTFGANPNTVTAVTFNREGFATTAAGFCDRPPLP